MREVNLVACTRCGKLVDIPNHLKMLKLCDKHANDQYNLDMELYSKKERILEFLRSLKKTTF